MKNKSTSQSAPARRSLGEGGFFNLRVLIGMFIVLAGAFLALIGLGTFSGLTASSAQAQQKPKIIDVPGLPPGFDCAQISALGINKQENLRAGLIMIACGESEGGSPLNYGALLFNTVTAPLAYGGTDVDLITGTDNIAHPTQSETYTTANPDNPNQIVVTYNDSRTASANYSGASYSSDGGTTFTRLNPSPFASGHGMNFGDPVTLYNKPTSTFFAIFLATGCGQQGIGAWKSSDGGVTWTVGACIHSGDADDRESGVADNNPSSPFFGRMYVSWNDFLAGGLKVRFSTDNGATWNNERQLTPASPFIRDTQITVDKVTGDVYVAGMNEGPNGGLAGPRANKIYRSTDGGNTWTNTYTGPNFTPAGRANCTANPYFVCMYAPDTWRHMGWGEPAAYNQVVSYVYAQHGAGADAGDVMYIRSTNRGVTFSAPLKLNTDTTTRAQWQPNLSVSDTGTLFSQWYDERETTSCQVGNPAVPCYRMWARKSTDNGATWLADMAFSDVISPLPSQPDGTVQPNYQGDYDYGSAVGSNHLTSWCDGRVIISGQSQQNTFFDKEPAAAGGGPNLVSAASRLTHGSAGTFAINMPLTGTSGVEDRNAAGSFLAVFTFDAAVTSGNAAIVGGTATAGTPTFSGKKMRVPLTGVADVQIVTIRISNVNGGGGTRNVAFGFLKADVNANRTVDRPDLTQINADMGQIVNSSNFRDDINLSGRVDLPDKNAVNANMGHHIP